MIGVATVLELRPTSFNRGSIQPSEQQKCGTDVCRKNAGTQVGFGAGIHHCLGANLAREEMVQTFDILLDRLDHLALADDTPLAHHPSLILRGLKSLPVTFTAA